MQLLVQIHSHSKIVPNRVKGIVYLYFFKPVVLVTGGGSLRKHYHFFFLISQNFSSLLFRFLQLLIKLGLCAKLYKPFYIANISELHCKCDRSRKQITVAEGISNIFLPHFVLTKHEKFGYFHSSLLVGKSLSLTK